MDRQVPSLSFPLLLFVRPGAPLPGVAIPGSCLFSSHCSFLCPPFGRFDLAPLWHLHVALMIGKRAGCWEEL